MEMGVFVFLARMACMAMLQTKDGNQLYYEWTGEDGSKPCLVFLHEGLGCTEMWGHFPQHLCRATGLPGLSYDRLGYGKSSVFAGARTKEYLQAVALQELPEVISSLLPGRDYVLVGHSDGGSIGLIYAAQKPEGLCGLIAEAAHVFVESVTLDGIRQAVQAYDDGKLRGLHHFHGDKTENVFRAWHETWLSEWFQDWNIEDVLPPIRCPVLVLQGADDRYGTRRQIDSIRSGIAAAQGIMIEGCGHSPHRQKEHLVLKLMAEFIKRALEAECSNQYRQS
jgi:pimeloyl-ACP methyl ester carboxylesterase